jgi:hypothetical protein
LRNLGQWFGLLGFRLKHTASLVHQIRQVSPRLGQQTVVLRVLVIERFCLGAPSVRQCAEHLAQLVWFTQ